MESCVATRECSKDSLKRERRFLESGLPSSYGRLGELPAFQRCLDCRIN
jgi:hypothetical protein